MNQQRQQRENSRKTPVIEKVQNVCLMYLGEESTDLNLPSDFFESRGVEVMCNKWRAFH
jgi:hypothetical protein